jgi:RNA polymerase sigma-70 factor, ECF subfamily
VYDRRNSEFSGHLQRCQARLWRKLLASEQTNCLHYDRRNAAPTGEHLRERSESLISQRQTGTKQPFRLSKQVSVREATSDAAFEASRQRECLVSYGEQVALRGHADIESVASAAELEVRPTPDDQFLERLRRGEAAAYERLVAEHSGDVYALIFRLTNDGEEARDLTQETFLRAFQSINRFRGDASLKTWIYRIAINQARNRWRWWRRRKRDVTVSLDATDDQNDQPLSATIPGDNSLNPEQETLAREREGQLRNALLELRSAFREAVVLRDVEGFSYEEIAEMLQISIGTVKSRIARGRMELRRQLEGSL